MKLAADGSLRLPRDFAGGTVVLRGAGKSHR
jgi:hypothetical protein